MDTQDYIWFLMSHIFHCDTIFFSQAHSKVIQSNWILWQYATIVPRIWWTEFEYVCRIWSMNFITDPTSDPLQIELPSEGQSPHRPLTCHSHWWSGGRILRGSSHPHVPWKGGWYNLLRWCKMFYGILLYILTEFHENKRNQLRQDEIVFDTLFPQYLARVYTSSTCTRAPRWISQNMKLLPSKHQALFFFWPHDIEIFNMIISTPFHQHHPYPINQHDPPYHIN